MSFGSSARVFKIAESTHPIPDDRIVFSAHHYADGLNLPNDAKGNADVFFCDVEKLLSDNSSIMVRLPFASALAADQIDGEGNGGNVLGDLALIYKQLLYRDERTAFSAGGILMLPTGSNATLYTKDGQIALNMENQAVHLAPFLGFSQRSEDRRWSLVGFSQIEFDAHGNPWQAPGMQRVGRQQTPTVLTVDTALNYWLYHAACDHGWLQGVASSVELHYTGTLQDADLEPTTLTYPQRRWDVLNATGALRFALAGNQLLSVGAGAPLCGEHLYSAEIMAQWMWLY